MNNEDKWKPYTLAMAEAHLAQAKAHLAFSKAEKTHPFPVIRDNATNSLRCAQIELDRAMKLLNGDDE